MDNSHNFRTQDQVCKAGDPSCTGIVTGIMPDGYLCVAWRFGNTSLHHHTLIVPLPVPDER